MPEAWTGANPTLTVDSVDYELGTVQRANEDLTITHVRVWADATSQPYAGRSGRIWSTAGALLAEVSLPTTLDPGWSTHELPAPVERTALARWVVSYTTGGNYGSIPAALATAVVSSDGAVTALATADAANGNGVFNTTPGDFPTTTFNSTFYGVDVVYALGLPGGMTPNITGVALSTFGLTVTATINASDADGLAGATYRISWGDGATTEGPAAQLAHTYATGGLKAILASVTDSTGLSAYAAAAAPLAGATSGMQLADVMDAVADRLKTITGPPLRTFAYPPGKLTPPGAVVTYPDNYTFDATYGRGMDRLSLPVVIVVGKVSDRSARDQLAEYCAGAGPRSIKAVLESGIYTAFDTIRVEDIDFDVATIGGTDYISAVFTLDIAGPGSA